MNEILRQKSLEQTLGNPLIQDQNNRRLIDGDLKNACLNPEFKVDSLSEQGTNTKNKKKVQFSMPLETPPESLSSKLSEIKEANLEEILHSLDEQDQPLGYIQIDSSGLDKNQESFEGKVEMNFNELLTALNDLRAHPAEWAKKLNTFNLLLALENSIDKNWGESQSKKKLIYSDASNLLKALAPLPPLKLNFSLSQAAQENADFLARNHSVTWEDPNYDSTLGRVSKYGNCESCNVAEISLKLGSTYDFQKTLLEMVIDEGVSKRTRRRKLFNPYFRYVGIACSKLHKSGELILDFIFASEGFQEKEELPVLVVKDVPNKDSSNVFLRY